MKTEKKLLGKVCVETGTIAFVDPAYAQELVDLIGTENPDANPSGAATLAFENGVEFAVVSKTHIGDGHYPVYLEHEGDVPLRLVVDLETRDRLPPEWQKKL